MSPAPPGQRVTPSPAAALPPARAATRSGRPIHHLRHGQLCPHGFARAGWRTRPAIWANPGCVPRVLNRTIPGMITGRDRDPAAPPHGARRCCNAGVRHKPAGDRFLHSPRPVAAPSAIPSPRQPPHHRTAVPTGPPIGWARVSASVLNFQRARSARTQPRQAAFASSPARSRAAVIWPWPSPRLRPGREVLAQPNHFHHWDRRAPEWLIWAPHIDACADGPEAPSRYASEVPDCDLVICPQSVTIAFRVPKSRDAAHLWVTTQQCAVTTGSLDGWPGRWLPPLPRAISRNRQGPRHPEQAVAPDGWPLRAPAPAGLEAAPPRQASGPGAAAVAAGNEVGITGARMCALPLCSAHLCAASSAGTWT